MKSIGKLDVKKSYDLYNNDGAMKVQKFIVRKMKAHCNDVEKA